MSLIAHGADMSRGRAALRVARPAARGRAGGNASAGDHRGVGGGDRAASDLALCRGRPEKLNVWFPLGFLFKKMCV